MDNTNSLAVAVGHSVNGDAWQVVLAEVLARIGGRFARAEPRQAAGQLLTGLIAPIERKNSWWLAEHAGHVCPDRMQRLLRTAVWDDQAVSMDLRDLVVAEFGRPDAVLVIDETGFLKKGVCSVGVQRQYTGTAGRIENSQVGVFLAYVSDVGHALIDRRLYVPRSWLDDPDRCTAAGVPDIVEFTTKPQLALQMIEHALAAGVPAGFVAGDEVYGADPVLRDGLRNLGVGYVLAIARNQYIPVTDSIRERADQIAAQIPDHQWQRRTCGPGSKGPRYYDWAWIRQHDRGQGVHSLLVRRASDGELAFYRCWTSSPTPITTLIRVAGRRWAVESQFQTAKGQVGLDQYQCRGWRAWHRFTLLAMLALAALTICVARTTTTPDPEMIPVTVPELRRLINALTSRIVNDHKLWLWSRWRRRHQATARRSHYKRRNAIDISS